MLEISFIANMKLCGNTSEFQQLMFLQSFGKGDGIKIAICRSGIFEGFIILFLDVEFIESIVDGFDVSILDGNEVWFDKWDVIGFFEHADNASMVNSRSKSSKEIREQSRMFLEVEVESSVINLEIGSLDGNLFERVVFLRLACKYATR